MGSNEGPKESFIRSRYYTNQYISTYESKSILSQVEFDSGITSVEETKAKASVFQTYAREALIITNGVLLWGSIFSFLGVGTYQIVGDFFGMDVSAFPSHIMTNCFAIGATLGFARGFYSSVEFGLLKSNVLKELTQNYVDDNIPPGKQHYCDIQHEFSAEKMEKWLKKSNPLQQYKTFLLPVWHRRDTLAKEFIYQFEPGLKAIDAVVNYHPPNIAILDGNLLTTLVYPHAEVALCHIVQRKKSRVTVYSFLILSTAILLFIFTDFIKEYLPLFYQFVQIYEQLKEQGTIASDNQSKEYFRDSSVLVLALVTSVLKNLNRTELDALAEESEEDDF